MELCNKTALVTGASSGIGRATAIALAAKGARVTLTARRTHLLNTLSEQLPRGASLVAPADLTKEEELAAMLAASDRRWGGLDILVNAAGIGRETSLYGGETRQWLEMYELNVLALSKLTREAVRRFDPQGGGHVLHVSSLAAHRPPRTGSFYAATKHTVRALADALRSELHGIGSKTRISCVSPAWVATGFFDEYFSGDRERLSRASGGCRMLTPEEVAATILFVLEAPGHIEIHDVVFGPQDSPL
jgi:NADP-dependent 3-hydroxy acid dehydrogenase YdfG